MTELAEAVAIVVREMRVGHDELTASEAVDDARNIVDLSDVVGHEHGADVETAFRIVKGHPGGTELDNAVEAYADSDSMTGSNNE